MLIHTAKGTSPDLQRDLRRLNTLTKRREIKWTDRPSSSAFDSDHWRPAGILRTNGGTPKYTENEQQRITPPIQNWLLPNLASIFIHNGPNSEQKYGTFYERDHDLQPTIDSWWAGFQRRFSHHSAIWLRWYFAYIFLHSRPTNHRGNSP